MEQQHEKTSAEEDPRASNKMFISLAPKSRNV